MQNIERVKNPENASPYASSLAAVESVEATDEATVDLPSGPPFPGLLGNLTRVPIIPLEAAEEMKTNPVGAGPFKFIEWVSDSHIEYERFDRLLGPGAAAAGHDARQLRAGLLGRQGQLPVRPAGHALLIPLIDIPAFDAMASEGFHARSGTACSSAIWR